MPAAPYDLYAHPLLDGWLVGLYAGEFGGGLWWFDAMGMEQRQLERDPVAGIVQRTWGLAAVVGLAHGGASFGRVIAVGARDGHVAILRTWELDSAPVAYAADGNDALLIVTRRSLYRLTPEKIVVLLDLSDVDVQAISVARREDGAILVGARGAVAVVAEGERERANRVTWWAPPGCSVWKRSTLGCSCH